MAANSTDKFKLASNGSRPSPTTLTATKAVAASSISCGALTGWPTTTGVAFCIYTTDTSGKKVAGSQTDWRGVVSGTTITNLALVAGTDNGYSIGAIVEAAPVAAWADDLANGLLVQHNQDGTHAAVTATSINVSGAVTLPASSVTNTMLATGVQTSKLANPYKFAAYRSAALSIAGSSAFTKVTFETKEFDTGTNFDIATNIGRFTAPVAGFYRFSTTVGILTAGAFIFSINLYKNGSLLKTLAQVKTGSANTSLNGTIAPVQASLNDYFEIYAFSADTGANNANVGQAACWFAGELVSLT